MLEVAILAALAVLVGVAGYAAGQNDERHRTEKDRDNEPPTK